MAIMTDDEMRRFDNKTMAQNELDIINAEINSGIRKHDITPEDKPIFIVDAKKKSKRKYLELPLFINFGDEATPEDRKRYWKMYHKQRTELSKNRKFNRQSKGRQKPYRMHNIIKNLYNSSY
jgi:hypothetical protein